MDTATRVQILEETDCCILICRCMQKHIQHNKDERHSSLEKYTSHSIWKGSKGLLKVLLWEGVGDRTELQHIDPHSCGHKSVSFPFSWATEPGVWGPSLSGTCSSFQHLLSNWSEQLINRGPEGPLCWVLVFSTASYPQLMNFLCTELYNCSTSTFFLWVSQIALNQPVHGQGYFLIFLYLMHLLFTQVHFLFWQLGRGQYVTWLHFT